MLPNIYNQNISRNMPGLNEALNFGSSQKRKVASLMNKNNSRIGSRGSPGASFPSVIGPNGVSGGTGLRIRDPREFDRGVDQSNLSPELRSGPLKRALGYDTDPKNYTNY